MSEYKEPTTWENISVTNTQKKTNKLVSRVYNPKCIDDSDDSVRKSQPVDIWTKDFKWDFT